MDKFDYNKNKKNKDNISLINNIDNVIKRIIKAVNNGKKIVVYGYYDLDCISGISILILILRYLNADVEYYIPNKINERYELSLNDIEDHIKYLGANLIITVGCGINSKSAVKHCNDMGMDVIVTDYHIYKGKIKNPYIISSKSNKTNYFNELTASGLIYKVCEALCFYYKINFIDKYSDLAMLGIMSKDVSLYGENKRLVLKGINKLSKTNNYGLKSLMKVHKINKVDMSTIYKLIFSTIPTVNAMGTMDNARIIVELFTTSDSYRAEQISKYLKKQAENEYINKNKRKEIIKLRIFSKKLQL